MTQPSAPVFDVIVVGGGPSGSACARSLVLAGLRVAIIDRAEFPREKLCAGWLSPGIWDALELSPRAYPAGLWEWQTCHVRYLREDHAVPCHGWFIRRYELDEFLLRRSGAELHLGVAISQLERDAEGWWSVAGLRSRFLVGAGGTHCPVARLLAPPRRHGPVGAQELELHADGGAVARTRIGDDGEPELLLFEGVGGYGWNVAKTDWLNVGCGTLEASRVREAWQRTQAELRACGHIPHELEAALLHMKGHAYHLFDPAHLASAAQADADGHGGAFIIGDALGLAHPITAEGILPAVRSGRHLAEAIIEGSPASYPERLRADPLFADYRRIHEIVAAAQALRRRWPARAGSGPVSSLERRAVAHGFAWLFSGAKLPVPRLLDLVLSSLPNGSSSAGSLPAGSTPTAR